ncbi:MAG: translation initiation factor IF-2 [Deltaproteobacteria bacterium]
MTARTPAERVMAFKALLVAAVVIFAVKHGLNYWLFNPGPRLSDFRDSDDSASSNRDSLRPAGAPPRALVQSPRQVDSRRARQLAAATGRPRHLQLSVLQARLRPGLCAPSSAAKASAVQARGARAARARVRARFRDLGWGESAHLYLDPRLPDAAYQPVLYQLEEAEREVRLQLGFEPARPDVFVYFDTQLLLATSCTNEGVGALYDGALHLAVTGRDGQQSVIHQYVHHALTSQGLLGPAWAQEGIALLIAKETWWSELRWLQQVANAPLALEALEQDLPDTLPQREAALFSAQAAVMVSCAAGAYQDHLAGLVKALGASTAHGELTYQLPELAEPANLPACLEGFLP